MAFALTHADIAVVNAARAALAADHGTPDSADQGRLAEAVTAAEKALFHVANVARSYVGMDLTEAELYGPQHAQIQAARDA